MGWNFFIFYDYVIAYYVIGHPEVKTDNFGFGLYGIKNRLVKDGLHKK